MSDGKFLRNDRLKSVLSRIKTRVGSDIASAISESTLSLTSIINSGDSTTLGSAKGYADGLKIVIDSNISTGDTNTLNSAKSYTDGKTQNKFELEDLVNSPVDVGDIIVANDQAGLKGKSSGVKLSNLASSSHTHSTSDITDVNSLAAASHTHTESEITDLKNYALNNHTHLSSDLIDGTTAFASKSHTHTTNEISNFGNYANSNHTHVEADITDLGNYSVDGHTHTLSDITDITATAIEVNTLDGITATTAELNNTVNSTSNIQIQLNDARMCGFFPAWEYNKEYHCEDVVKTPGCKPLQYLECIVDGTSGYIQKVTIIDDNQVKDDIEYYIIPHNDYGHYFAHGFTETITNSSVRITDLENFNAGDTIIDGSTAWIVQDLRDGRLIGEITSTTHWIHYPLDNIYKGNQYGLDLRGWQCPNESSRSSHMLYEGTQQSQIDDQIFKIKFIRLLKYIINTSLLLNQTGKTSNNNPARLFNLVCGASLLLKNGNTFSNSFAGSGIGTHCVGGIILMDWSLHPFDYLSNDRVNIIDENVFKYLNIETYNHEFSYTKTKNDYVTQAIAVKNQMKTYGIDWHTDNSLYCNMTKLDYRYLRFGHYGTMIDPGLPNITGSAGYIKSTQMTETVANNYVNSTNAFKWSTKKNDLREDTVAVSSGSYAMSDLNFNASRQNAIYGSSTTVTPNTLNVEMMMKF